METKVVLIVDDDPTVIQLVSHVLKSYYTVKAVTRGQQVMEVALAEPKPSLIILDVLVPDKDGYEVCRALKSTPATRDIPIIFATGNASPEEIKYGQELGGAGYLTKPLDPEVLLAKVTQLFG